MRTSLILVPPATDSLPRILSCPSPVTPRSDGLTKMSVPGDSSQLMRHLPYSLQKLHPQLLRGILIGFSVTISSLSLAFAAQTLRSRRKARNLRRAVQKAEELRKQGKSASGEKLLLTNLNDEGVREEDVPDWAVQEGMLDEGVAQRDTGVVNGVVGLIEKGASREMAPARSTSKLAPTCLKWTMHALSPALFQFKADGFNLVLRMGKAEFLNPGGSVKDRVALKIIETAEESGLLVPHTSSRIFEGTVGSTGISIATVGRAKGYEATIIMPDDVSIEKVQVLEKLGAQVERVRPASIVDEKQFVNLAKTRALEFGRTRISSGLPSGSSIQDQGDIVVTQKSSAPTPVSMSLHASGSSTPFENIDHPTSMASTSTSRPRGFFADQFENEANYLAHFEGTGPEIWRQTRGRIDAFVSGAGTGGTIAGTAAYLHGKKAGIKIVLSDPEGSGLYNKVKYGVMFDFKEQEGRKRRHQVDTVVEGIGINRLTHNFSLGSPHISDAYRILDSEAIAMSRHLVLSDGLYLGSSSACNLVASCRLAKTLPKGSTIVTILCDAGSRHQSKFWSDDWLRQNGYTISSDISFLL